MLYRLAVPVFLYLVYYAAQSPDADTATQSHPAAPGGVRAALLQWVLDSCGVGKLTPGQIGMLTLVMVVYSVVVGYLVDMMLKEKGFGHYINGLLSLVGACCGLVLFARLFGDMKSMAHFEYLITIIVVASMATVAAAAALKVLLMEEVGAVMSGGSTKFGSPTKKSAASADRMAMVTRKRD